MKPEIDVVIVSYNSRATLRNCVEPIVAMPGVTVTVVDNASPDALLDAIDDLPVQRLEARYNGGFAFACNLGMALGRAPLVLFLNPDARIEPAELERLAAVLASEPGVGIVGPRSLEITGELSPSLRRVQDAGSTWAQALFLHRVLPWAKWANETIWQPAAHERVAYPDWLPGACLLGRRDLLERLGGFDEGFFLYCEDMDLCTRVWAAGYAVRFEPHAVARHHGGRSAPRTSLFATFARSRIRYARLHAGPVSAFVQHGGLAVGALTHVLVNAGRPGHALGHAAALRKTPGRDVH